MVDSDRANGPRSRKGAQTRARLLEAAKEIFEENGFLGARISDIAQRAGVSHGSFYHYYDSKEQVFREVAQQLEERLSAPLGSVILAPTTGVSPRERLLEANRRFLEDYRDEARIIGVIEQVSRYDDDIHELRVTSQRRSCEQVAESIRQLQKRDLADPRLDPVVAAWALGAMVHRFAEMWLVQGYFACGFDECVEQLTTLVVNTIGLRA